MNEKTSENKSVSLKRIDFRPQTWLAELVETTMKEQKIKSVTEAMHYLMREREVLKEQLAFKLESLRSDYPPCDLRIYNHRTNLYECLKLKPPVNLKHFSKDGLLPEVCVKCQNVKTVKKTTHTKPKKDYRYQESKRKNENYQDWADPTQNFKGNTY